MWSKIKNNPHVGTISGLASFFFALAMVWGQGLNKQGEIPIRIYVSWLAFALLFAVVWCVLFLFLEYIQKNASEEKGIPEKDGTKEITESDSKKLRKKCMGLWAAIFFCWIPSLLAVYPGFFLYDAMDEYTEVVTRIFTTHHPLLHVLMLGGSVRLFYKLTGSYNLGIAVYILFQMLVVSGVFAYMLMLFEKRGIKKAYRIATFVYVVAFPLVVMFTLCSAKDTLFAALLLLGVMCFMEWTTGAKADEAVPFVCNYKRWIGLAFVFAATLLLRNNALYAFIAFAVFVIAFQKGKRKNYILFMVLVLLISFVGNKGLAVATHAAKGGYQEILTVPIQQLSRAYRADPGQFSETDREILTTYIPEEALGRYTPKLSDPVKVHFDNEAFRESKAPFIKLWLKAFGKNPIGYLNAWFMTSYGYWYPDAEVDVYEGHVVFTHSYENSSYFGFETEQPGERDSKFPFVERIFEEISLEDIVQEIPVVSWMFSMGAVFWLYVLCICVMLVKKAYKKLLAFVFPAFVWLTLLLGPTYLPRYVVFLWYMLPLMVAVTFLDEKETSV